MIFRLTKKVQKQLSLKELVRKETGVNKNFFTEWNVNIIILKNIEYLMLTEGKTLFTIIEPVSDTKTKEEFELLVEQLFVNILNELIESKKIDRLKIDNCIYAKTENNYIRRAQIDLQHEAEELIDRNENLFNVNRMPLGKELRYPVEYFIEEISNILLKDGRVFVEDVLNN
ncbi:DUF6933 domain-containing protein [Marispirochaeta aestuarii]|uniref:DUF6933 domain-containing protein n=1 Tax=Marispirochaeta aestuarii TaxID=1963862 RepID=UPI0029C7AFD0|nr:hypothetical protein [Marispirochaeta aestuarii]